MPTVGGANIGVGSFDALAPIFRYLIVAIDQDAGSANQGGCGRMPTYRVYFLDDQGTVQHTDYKTLQALLESHEQIGVEEDSYALRLHGEPVLRGLIGPMTDGKTVIKYESPQVFVRETEEWSKQRRPAKD